MKRFTLMTWDSEDCDAENTAIDKAGIMFGEKEPSEEHNTFSDTTEEMDIVLVPQERLETAWPGVWDKLYDLMGYISEQDTVLVVCDWSDQKLYIVNDPCGVLSRLSQEAYAEDNKATWETQEWDEDIKKRAESMDDEAI